MDGESVAQENITQIDANLTGEDLLWADWVLNCDLGHGGRCLWP